MPPLAPMLAKSVKRDSRRRARRAEVGRLPHHRLQGRRRDRAGEPQRAPMTRYFPELVEALRENLPAAVRDRRRDRPRHRRSGSTSTRCSSASTRPRAGSRCSPRQTPASFVAFDLLAVGDDDLMDGRSPTGAGGSRRRSPRHPTPSSSPRPPPTSPRRATGSRGSRAPASTGWWPSRSTAPTSPTSARCSRSSTSAPPTAWSPGSAGTRAAAIVGSLLLGLYDGDGRLHHVGVAASFPMARRASLVAELEPLVADDLSTHPWGEWADQEAHSRHGCRVR